MPNVEFVKPELSKMFPVYDTVRDCVGGDQIIKAAGTRYLPMPNVADQSPENRARYAEYLARAVFYNVTKRTVNGLIGQVTAKDPEIIVPSILNPVVKDADGEGTSLKQLMERCEELVLNYGRAGVLTDFPDVQGPITAQMQLEGAVRPTLSVYRPENIINWKTRKINNVKTLSLVVLKETYPDPTKDNDFEENVKIQYRVLRLNPNGIYVQEIWRNNEGASGGWSIYQSFNNIRANGAPLTEIPFRFVGSNDNNPEIDPSPIYDLAALNVAHYHNSADYEESIFVVGQPTLFMYGMTEAWMKVIGTVYMGSRAGISLPEGASAELLQAEGNTMAFEAMQHKERQMVALGAKLVEQTSVQRTATEASQEKATESSVLKKVTNNVSDAFKWSMEWCAIFAGAMTVRSDATSDTIKTQLNTDFDISKGSPEQINAAINAWQKGAITFSEMRTALTRGGMATETAEEAQAVIEKEQLKEADIFRQTNEIQGIEPGNTGGNNGE